MTALDRAALARSGVDSAAAPVRIVHIGLGAFHRAHQAWYTEQVDAAREWGIAAFTGRSPKAADELAAQDGLYALLTQHADHDEVEVIRAISEAHDGADVAALRRIVAASATAVVTLTITEAGYPTDAAAWSDDVAAIAAGREPRGAIARLVTALDARRRAAAGPIAVVPCDNLPENGPLARAAVLGIAEQLDAGLAGWIDAHVAFASTSIDRITPRTTADDVDAVRALTGWDDRSPVVTEPFRDWVIQGDFPAGRPAWEAAGARFVDDLEPWEQRKLWLLNGAHTLLANAGPARGHETVAEAIADPGLRRAVDALWDEAERHLPFELDVPAYRSALVERFENARIRHRLAQIAQDSLQKLRVRVAPVALAELAAGRTPEGAASAIGAWAGRVAAGLGEPDRGEADLAAARAASDPVRALVAAVDPRLADDERFLAAARAAAHTTATKEP
ncbi:mannitol dehydrogenase family protein [Agrococcus sp. BE272]|uniref:mannitol dehydrogenase family protein n=1 Tax=Agrococcus sp. BE272 TaxID=2817727 RepID=UPI00285952D9|nr:mannitol dehydrogenase family protein [Agrococcus sp. BE272]MDR7235018.1 fructuronate reductase [Agrococcus sp. BE272]